MLWKFDFMVEGKNLEKVMAALAGIALEFQTPTPVANGILRRGAVKQQVEGSSNSDRLMNKLTADGLAVKGQFISSSVIQMAMAELQIPKGNYGTIMTALKAKNLMASTERRGTIRVL